MTRDDDGRLRLEVIEIAEPCTEDWDAMRGDAQVRFCGLCERNVYDLSAMTRAEAEALVDEREGRLCVRFVRRADGTVTTSDCAPDRIAALRRRAKKSLAWAAVATAGLMTVVGALGAASLAGGLAAWLNEPDVEETPLLGAPMPLHYEPLPEVEEIDPAPEPSEPNAPSDEASRGR